MAKEPEVLEQSGDKEPDLDIILHELTQAQSDATWYWQRMQQAKAWWQCTWNGQTVDGRCHADAGAECYPWENASDSRLRTVQTLINEHVTVAKYAFWNAKIQVRSNRPFIQGLERNVAQRALQWRVYTHMRNELLRELPLAFGWRFGYGLSFIGVQWEQQRRIDYVPISIEQLEMIVTATQDPMATSMLDAIMDETQEDVVVNILMASSPILTKSDARGIIKDLRSGKETEMPVSYPYVNKPRWTALRPCVDILFPSETSDIQQARFVDLIEPIDEATLRDRIETEGYDEAFVDAALEHKGEAPTTMQQQPDWQASSYAWGWQPIIWGGTAMGSMRDLVFLHHFHYKIMDMGVPCVYKTIFCESTLRRNGSKPLYGWHGKFQYDHGQYPVCAFRREYGDRSLLSSRGISEEAYTDEQNIKVQQDGLSNHTDLLHNLPMIVPPMRVGAIKGAWSPRAVLGARPGEITWAPVPPLDQTPVAIIQMVMERLDRRYPLFNINNPELTAIYRQTTTNDILGEMEAVLEQTFQLMQQYEMDEEIAQVSGQPDTAFHVNKREIQGKYEITATLDARQIDIEYAQEKMALIAQAMAFKQEGMLFNLAVEMIDPDLADIIAQDQTSPAAMEKERNDEIGAISMAMVGMEAPFPQMGNPQLRLGVLQQYALQNPNPAFQARLASQPDSQKILQNRVKLFMNQIQQFQNNPQIGRIGGTAAFQKNLPPTTTTAQ